MSASQVVPQLPLKRILSTWWPLAASWLLMGAELPILSAVVARLPNPEINLAAYGGIVFPLALIIESPIIMLLAASTALSKDTPSYQLLHRFMMVSGAALTGLHILIAFTPLYYFVVENILGAPAEIVEPGRIGLMLMTPWTWSIAYRRFNQGVLIRFNRSKTVGIGTVIRLTADLVVLMTGYAIGSIQGIVVATCAVSAGVISEAIYSGIVVRPVVRTDLRQAPLVPEPLTWRLFFRFYTPLVMTSLLTLLVQPLGSAALGRMPRALESLAVWPVVSGLIFMLRSLGVAYNEVVVALLDDPISTRNLRRFAGILAGGTTLIMFLFAATPLAHFWFAQFSGLSPVLAGLAVVGIWIALPIPALTVLQSWYQGIILQSHQTRGITEAVIIFLVTSSALLGAGVWWGGITGLFVGLAAFVAANLTQTAWLWFRSRLAEQAVRERDQNMAILPAVQISAD
jgi:hypothetical protein